MWLIYIGLVIIISALAGLSVSVHISYFCSTCIMILVT
ncbi:hypothetical protein [Ureibacillus sp. GCM10028918]